MGKGIGPMLGMAIPAALALAAAPFTFGASTAAAAPALAGTAGAAGGAAAGAGGAAGLTAATAPAIAGATTAAQGAAAAAPAAVTGATTSTAAPGIMGSLTGMSPTALGATGKGLQMGSQVAGLSSGIIGQLTAPTPHLPSPTPSGYNAPLPNFAGGMPETPGAGLVMNIPSAGPTTGQQYGAPAMGNNIAQNLLSDQNPFFQWAQMQQNQNPDPFAQYSVG